MFSLIERGVTKRNIVFITIQSTDIRKVIVFSTILYVSFSCYAVADEDHKTQNKSNGEIRCPSSLNDLAHEADVCTKPLMDMLEGRTKKWAKNENDVAEVCKSVS